MKDCSIRYYKKEFEKEQSDIEKRMDIEGSNSRRPIFTLIPARHPLIFFTFDIGERPMVADTPNPIRESGVTGLLFEGKPWNIYMKQATNSSITKETNVSQCHMMQC